VETLVVNAIDKTPGRSQQRCPICGEPTEQQFRPFCSRRCADVDLSRWLKGVYAIPGRDADDDEDGDGASAAAAISKGGVKQPEED
jgi:endogenous inhibitor of DNA gyrase (YacG/DUF329 family)